MVAVRKPRLKHASDAVLMSALSRSRASIVTLPTRLEATDGMPALIGCVCENEHCRAAHVDGFPGYAVTECGCVFSCRHKGRGVSYRDKWSLLKPHANHNGLQQVGLRRLGKKHWLLVSHIVLRHFDRPDRPNECALHLDCDKSNCALSNLEWLPLSEVRYASKQIAERTEMDADEAVEKVAESLLLTPALYRELLDDLSERATDAIQSLIPSRPASVIPDYEAGTMRIEWLWPEN